MVHARDISAKGTAAFCALIYISSTSLHSPHPQEAPCSSSPLLVYHPAGAAALDDIRTLPVKRMSWEELPTMTSKLPSASVQLCTAGSHTEELRLLRGKLTVFDSPGWSSTFWKPFSCRGGSPALGGYERYNCGTSEPARVPLLRTSAVTSVREALRLLYCQVV